MKGGRSLSIPFHTRAGEVETGMAGFNPSLNDRIQPKPIEGLVGEWLISYVLNSGLKWND